MKFIDENEVIWVVVQGRGCLRALRGKSEPPREQRGGSDQNRNAKET